MNQVYSFFSAPSLYLFVCINTTYLSAHLRLHPFLCGAIHEMKTVFLNLCVQDIIWLLVLSERRQFTSVAYEKQKQCCFCHVQSDSRCRPGFELGTSFVYDTLQACSHIRISDMKVSDFIQNEIVLPVDAQYRHQFQQMQWQILQIGGVFTKTKCGLLLCVYDPRSRLLAFVVVWMMPTSLIKATNVLRDTCMQCDSLS